MSTQPVFTAILTLTPPEAEGKVTITLQLRESDPVETADGGVKPLRDCTLDEIQAFADQLEAELGAAYAGRTIGALLDDPEVDVAIVGSTSAGADLLDTIVVLDATNSAETVEIETIAEHSGDDDATVDTSAEDVSSAEDAPTAEIELINDVPEIEDVGEVEDDEDAPAPSNDVVEDILIEEIPPRDAIEVADAEPIFEEIEEEEATPIDITIDPEPEMRTAGIQSSGKYPDHNATIIWLDERPMRIMQKHAESSMRREVAGVMIGPRPEKQPDGRYLVQVKDMIVAKHTRMSGASVTYTPESWRYMNDKLASKYPNGDMVMVGWYHTHPGFGIFLSNMDLFIHTNFFTQKWHIAYVLDPVGRKSGFFSWNREKSQVIPYRLPWPEWAPRSW